MASLKTLEIDTLRLRNLLVATKDNTFIPADNHLYSKGDGTTFWSTGVTAIQFINLSTTVSTNQSTNSGEINKLESTFMDFQYDIISTLFGFSTFSINLSTYTVSLKYTDDQLGAYSTQQNIYLSRSYQTKEEATYASNLLSSRITTTNSYIDSEVSRLSSVTESLNKLNTISHSTILTNISNYTGSTFTGIFAIEDRNKSALQTSIINNSELTQNNINALSTTIGSRFDINNLNNTQTNLNNAVSSLSAAISLNGQSTYNSSILYTNASISTLSTSINKNFQLFDSTINQNINTKITNISSQLSSYIQINNTNLSTFIGKQSTINQALTSEVQMLINKGLTQQLYNTFIQLETYSAGVVKSTISTVNNNFISTISSFTSFYSTSLQQANSTSFSYLVNSSFTLTISSLTTLVESTMTSSITGNTGGFSSTVNGLNQSNILMVADILSTNVVELSSLITYTQGQITLLESLKFYDISTLYYTQFKTAPSIIMNSVDGLVSLSNVNNVTGLDSLVASVINLDLSTYDNFYIYVSDISSEVFYGLTYTPSSEIVSKDISLKIDITSSYTNKFMTIDTSNLSNWLGLPKIYNKGTNALSATNTPLIYLSTFLGSHIVQMRLERNLLYIRDILTVPYIYTTMVITGYQINNAIIPNDPLLQQSSFIYCNTEIPLTWQTNDLNVNVGIKFEGKDLNGKKVTAWSGPYSSAKNTANIRAPYGSTLVKYDKMYLSIYPPSGFMSNPASGNTPGISQIFDMVPIDPPINVFTPSLNCKITVYNPGSVEKILEVSELVVNNYSGVNLVGKKYRDYVTITSTSSYPYQGDFNTWRTNNIFDGSQLTAFRGGQDANTIDYNAFISCELHTISAAAGRISSIEVTGSENNLSLFSMDGLSLKVENKNEPGIKDGLFSKIVTLDGRTPNVIAFD